MLLPSSDARGGSARRERRRGIYDGGTEIQDQACRHHDRAVEYFAEKGIGLVEETVKRDENGHITFAYLDVEFEGFAFHLTY